MKSTALRFVVLTGIVNLFADMTYEGGRGEVGAFLGSLGASGFAVGVVAGGGELVGYGVRALAGAIADRTGRYWVQAWTGYLINMLCVPALAIAGTWPAAAGLFIGERFGRGIRRPVIGGMIADAGRTIGEGWAFGLNEALDQTGATIGPLLVALLIARSCGVSFVRNRGRADRCGTDGLSRRLLDPAPRCVFGGRAACGHTVLHGAARYALSLHWLPAVGTGYDVAASVST